MSQRKVSHTVSQLVTCHIVHASTLPKRIQSLKIKRKRVYCKHLYYVFRFSCKVDYDSNKFIHVATYSYNDGMRLLELNSIVK